MTPFLERFGESQFCFLDFDGLFRHPHEDWRTLLRFLGLEFVDPPATVVNASRGKHGHNRVMRWIWDHELMGHLRSAPGPVKSIGKRYLHRGDRRYKELMESAKSPLPDAIHRLFDEDDARLSAWISERPASRAMGA